MYQILSITAFALFAALSGCSTTPGDAAVRAGHPTQAADLYQKGAEAGDALAALKLASLLRSGKVEESEFGKTIDWLVLSCELGNISGCHDTGNAFEYELPNLDIDYEKARDFYAISAEEGFTPSQYNLGACTSINISIMI